MDILMIYTDKALAAVRLLPPADSGELFRMLLEYTESDGKAEPKTKSDKAALAFAMLRTDIDRCIEQHQEATRRRQAAAANRWKRPAPAPSEKKEHQDQDKTETATSKEDDETAKELADYWNKERQKHNAKVNDVKKISNETTADLSETLRHIQKDSVKKAIEETMISRFLNGQNKRAWKATFAWLVQLENLNKVLAGNYENPKTTEEKRNSNGTDKQNIRAAENRYENPAARLARISREHHGDAAFWAASQIIQGDS